MAENTTGPATPWLAFVGGALFVAVLMVGYFIYAGAASAPARPARMDIGGLTTAITQPSPTAPSAPAPPPVPSTR
jgi:hypothetical protein